MCAAARRLRPGSLRHTFRRAREAGLSAGTLREFFDGALISPVLTAHPTEVRRKSTITRELEISELLDARELATDDPSELARIELHMRRAILVLWRTNMLRQAKLKVIDEVANARSYYDYTFFPEIPRIFAEIEDELAAQDPKSAGASVSSRS